MKRLGREYLFLAFGLLALAASFSDARFALAQTQEARRLPPGVTSPSEP